MRNVIFDPVFVKRKQGSSGGARESAQNSVCRTHSVQSMPLGNGSCLAQNRTIHEADRMMTRHFALCLSWDRFCRCRKLSDREQPRLLEQCYFPDQEPAHGDAELTHLRWKEAGIQ